MKKLLLFLPLLLAFPALAQVSLNVSKNYPAHIVYKLDDIVSTVKIDEAKQIKIAKKIQKIDSLANVSMANGESVNRLKSDYIIDAKFLKTILSQEELEKFIYSTDKDNRFLVALNSVSILKLQPEQLSKIRQLNDSLSTTPKMSLKTTAQFQNVKLRKILDSKQFVSLLKFLYKDQSMEDAKEDWERIVSLKINTPGKEKEEFRQIVEYYLNKNSFLDKKADQFTGIQNEIFEREASVAQPSLLHYANILSEKNYYKNRYASVIQFKKDLDLSKAQIDTLLVKYIRYEKVWVDNLAIDLKGNATPQKTVPADFEGIPQLLNTEQINKWLVLKNRKEATKKGKESWYKLETEGLTKDLDKDKTIQELCVYHLKNLIAIDKSRFWKTPETQYLVRDVERTKPEVLQQLDAISKSKSKNENAKNAMAW